MQDESTIKITDLSKKFKRHTALNHVSLNCSAGVYGLLGPNGAGKTTLMSILATLLKPSSGQVTIYGYDLVREGGNVRNLLGYVPQHVQLPGELTGKELLLYAASMKGINISEQRVQEVARVLAEVNLSERANSKIKSYSGGMKQRLGIAQALLGDPKLLILDEPTAGLDPSERIRFRNLITRWGQGRTILLSTHIVSDVEAICQHIAVLFDGEIRFQGDLEALAQQAHNKLWEVNVPVQVAERLYTEKLVVASSKEGSEMKMRILSAEKPDPQAVQAPPTIEDGYVAILKRGGGIT